MRKLFIIFLLIPTLILAQDVKKQKENNPKFDSKSGSTWSNNRKKETRIKGIITGKVKDNRTKEALEFASISLTHKRTKKM